MSKEIALFIRKFQNKNKHNDVMITSRNRFYINLMYYLQELDHKVLIMIKDYLKKNFLFLI